jgi:hypothetical protein
MQTVEPADLGMDRPDRPNPARAAQYGKLLPIGHGAGGLEHLPAASVYISGS